MFCKDSLLVHFSEIRSIETARLKVSGVGNNNVNSLIDKLMKVIIN